MDFQVFVGAGAGVGKDVRAGHDGALGPVVTPEKRSKTMSQMLSVWLTTLKLIGQKRFRRFRVCQIIQIPDCQM